jgi:hypothetical protein
LVAVPNALVVQSCLFSSFQKSHNLGVIVTSAFQEPTTPASSASAMKTATTLLQAVSQVKTGDRQFPIILILSEMQNFMVDATFSLGSLADPLDLSTTFALITRSLADALSICADVCGGLRPVFLGPTSFVGQCLDLGDDLTLLTNVTSPELSTPDGVRQVLDCFLSMSHLEQAFVQETCKQLAGLWVFVTWFIENVAQLASDITEPQLVTQQHWADALEATYRTFSKTSAASLGMMDYGRVRLVYEALAAFVFTAQLGRQKIGGWQVAVSPRSASRGHVAMARLWCIGVGPR